VLLSVRVSSWLFPSGWLILTRTTSTAMLSVTLACMVTWASMSTVVPSGCVMVTCGAKRVSSDTKKVVSVELMLLLESFAKNVTLYCPVKLGMVKLVL